MPFDYVCFPEKARLCSPADIGGKAANLAWLSARGFDVPPWFAVRAAAFRRQLDAAGVLPELPQIYRDGAVDAARLMVLRERFLGCEIFPALLAEITDAVVACAGARQNDGVAEERAVYWAVRSSVNVEDGQTSSFAGQFETCLFRSSLDEICAALKRVWASLFDRRVCEYALHKGIDIAALRVAVVVQHMVDADTAGVTFTANPVTGDVAQMLVSATYGLGEGVVSGVCDSDEFVLGGDGRIVDSKIAEKKQRYARAEGAAGVALVAVAAADSAAPSLSATQLRTLWSTCAEIAAARKAPQDIEWCFRGDRLYVLQTRPITAKTLRMGNGNDAGSGEKDNEIIWDNSNIQESFCGVTTPLTFAFAQNCYNIVYSQLYTLLGIAPERNPELKACLEKMLGIINGRVYYNINSWYTVLCFLPGFAKNKADMERMMGLNDPIDFELPVYTGRAKRRQKLLQLRAYAKLIACFVRFDRHFDSFNRNIARVYGSVDRGSLDGLAAPALLAKLDFLKAALLGHWQAPIINDFLVMMLNGICVRILQKAGLDDAVRTLNELMAGQKDIASTEPTKRIIAICKQIARTEALPGLIAAEDDYYLYHCVGEKYPAIAADIAQYIALFGDRVIGELKLETTTLREAPEHIYRIFRSYLADIERLDRIDLDAREQALRAGAEQAAFAQVGSRLGNLHLRLFKRLVARLRRAVKDREAMRLERSRAFGLARTLYLAIGREFARLGAIDDHRDIFFLTEIEIADLTKGLSYCADMRRVVAMRRDESARFGEHEPAHHFYTYGLPTHNNGYVYPYAETTPRSDGDGTELRGVGCYPGVVEAPVKIVLDPEDSGGLNGKILCAVRTDPGWAPLFPACSGLIVERGSTLSHSAVVARELGIPAIVNVPGVTRLLRDGESVIMDGGAGTIVRAVEEIAAVPAPAGEAV